MLNKESLFRLALERLNTALHGSKCVDESIEVVVFGSMSAGLERPDSDIDVLCFSDRDLKVKTDRLDLIVMPATARESLTWLRGELASHIVEYGTWIKGSCAWSRDVRIGDRAIESKRRRIAAFSRALPDRWSGLDEGFRVKYSIKLRREIQRLLLMERGAPVPPTRILDGFWDSISGSPHEVHNRLRQFTVSCRGSFAKDIYARIDLAFPLREDLKSPR